MTPRSIWIFLQQLNNRFPTPGEIFPNFLQYVYIVYLSRLKVFAFFRPGMRAIGCRFMAGRHYVEIMGGLLTQM